MGRIQGLSAQSTNAALMLWELLIEVKNEECSEENLEDLCPFACFKHQTLYSVKRGVEEKNPVLLQIF